ncbi:MAG: hypothetical protein GX060_05460 [Firmicutes bacterium]|nr:hypothetical protein [Bacillota bacterium]
MNRKLHAELEKKRISVLILASVTCLLVFFFGILAIIPSPIYVDATLYQQGSPLRLLLADTGELAIRPGASITVLLLPGGGKPVRSQVKVLEVEPTHDQQIIKVELPDQDLLQFPFVR